MVPSPPATRMRFVPWPIAASSRFSMSAGSTTSRSKPVFSASRAASAFPHLELRNALRAGGERREAGGGKRGGERREEKSLWGKLSSKKKPNPHLAAASFQPP